MDPCRNHQLGNRLRRAQSARRLHAYIGVSRMDQSDPTVLSISAKERNLRSKFALLHRADSYGRNDRQTDGRHHLPELWAKCNLVEKSKRSQRGDSQRSVRVLRTRTTCGATDSIFEMWSRDVHAIFRANPTCYAMIRDKGTKGGIDLRYRRHCEYQW